MLCFVEKEEVLNSELIKSYMFQMLCALCFCHSRRVVHRDLKPQNLLIDADGNIKLADFGLARAMSIPVRAYTHEVITMWYRPPEILLGQKKYSTPVDIWSLGAIFSEMITNKALFPGDSEIDQLFKIFRVLGTPNNEIWPGVENLDDYKTDFPSFKPVELCERLPNQNRKAELVPGAIDLLQQCLNYDPSQRISALKALDHSYFNSLNKQIYTAMRCPVIPKYPVKPDALREKNNSGMEY
jgi:serine/threonine protein kinase